MKENEDFEDNWRDRCSGYDKEREVCILAENRGWLYNRGVPGTTCPFNGSITKCESHSHPNFNNGLEVMAYIRYGIEPQQNIPFSELDLRNATLEGLLLDGVVIFRPNEPPKIILEDGFLHELSEVY
jgi:hypothetical protein